MDSPPIDAGHAAPASGDDAGEEATTASTTNGDTTAATLITLSLAAAVPALQPATPDAPTASRAISGFVPLVCVVDFHHARGPEVERWFGVPEGFDPAAEYDWSLLPFQALSDGAHAATEDFSYFTLLKPATDDGRPATSLFGIACTRQLDASQLINRPSDVTRSTVQKAVVVIADSPQTFGMLRQRLSIVTCRWFEQREFATVEILEGLQGSLADDYRRGLMNDEVDRDQYLGMSLRELVREFREKTLILLKCCLLQNKMLFFGSRCEKLCMIQFSLISLIPGLLRNLQDCAGPELNSYAESLKRATSLKTSDRNSLLAYMGMPFQIFGKGSLFGPYTPLQQLDILADHETKSYVVGSTNSLLLQQKERYSDILVNLDDKTVQIINPALHKALSLTTPDRRWIDFITQEVNETWDEANPGQPKDMGYAGSEEFIRLQFEEYLLNLASSVKYHNYLKVHQNNPRMQLPHIEGDPATDFGQDWIEAWANTENYRLWDSNTDTHIFDVNDPKHPCAGGLTIDDVQRRLAQQVQDLHLDERFAVGREVLGRNFAAGKERASTLFNKLYADMEAMREAQRKKAEEARAAQPSTSPGPASPTNGFSGVDLSKAQQTMQSVGAKASSYMSSWASWAGEKRKGWGRSASGSSNTSIQTGGGGWGFGSGRSRKSGEGVSFLVGSRSRDSSRSKFDPEKEFEKENAEKSKNGRPLTQDSFGESVLGSDDGTSSFASPVKPVPDTAKAAPPTPGVRKTEEVVHVGEVTTATMPAEEAGSEGGRIGDEVRVIRDDGVVPASVGANSGAGGENNAGEDEDDSPKEKLLPTPQDEATKVWASG